MNNAELIASLREAKNHFWTQPQIELYPMMEAAADALETAEQRIAELEAQLPQECEFRKIAEEYDGGKNRYCTVCGAYFTDNEYENHTVRYCYYCGSKVKVDSNESSSRNG